MSDSPRTLGGKYPKISTGGRWRFCGFRICSADVDQGTLISAGVAFSPYSSFTEEVFLRPSTERAYSFTTAQEIILLSIRLHRPIPCEIYTLQSLCWTRFPLEESVARESPKKSLYFELLCTKCISSQIVTL